MYVNLGESNECREETRNKEPDKELMVLEFVAWPLEIYRDSELKADSSEMEIVSNLNDG